MYDSPHQLEPLLPQRDLDPLIERTRAVFEQSLRLAGSVHRQTLDALRELVRSMNSYYSNLIEGQGTHPSNIDRALKADFSSKPDVAQRQRIALAHIEAERELEEAIQGGNLREGPILSSEFLLRAHRSLYSRLPNEDRVSRDGVVVIPGELRDRDVSVGNHDAPIHTSLPAFRRRLDEVYAGAKGVDQVLSHIAAAHHRWAWVHPFADGNGRACRLQTHCALFVTNAGLWSANRGLARRRERYYQMLAAADEPRRGDLDGRGNLSEAALREWCAFFIEVCEDQVSFMGSLLRLDRLKENIASLLAARAASSRFADYRREATLPLYHVAISGSLARGDFTRMMGIPERTAQRTLAALVKDGLLESDSPKSPVRLGFPLDGLGLLLPGLYPEVSLPNPDP